ncbi:MAG: hypothetical protein VB130_10865 [Clostridium sp.]|nr:hypothetical protein [Clostridium sp.]
MSSIDDKKFKNLSKKSTKLYELDNLNNPDIISLVSIFQNRLKQKDHLITHLKRTINEEKVKSTSYENKLKEMSSQYGKFLEGKDRLNGILKYLQENLSLREEEIDKFKKLNNIKENEIISLKNEISLQEDRIHSLVEEIRNLQKEIEYLSNQSNLNESKSSNSFFDRIFK